MTLIRIDRLLGDLSREGLGKLVQQARDLSGLTARLRAVLPPETRPHLVGANLREGGDLVVVASSPAWAARLRFEADTLLEAARGAGADAARLSVRVASRR
ncbi:MAG TPA: DciA family protein [Woeseiaceae bacterium]|nr:DciA family protein [Woeseiaceae bacterium]